MRTPIGALIFLSILVALDIYVFQALKVVSQTASPKIRLILFASFWTLTVISVLGFLIFAFTDHSFLPLKFRTYLFAIIIGLFLAKLLSVFFLLADDIRRILQWLIGKLLYTNKGDMGIKGDGITRSVFLSWLGLAAGGTLFSTLLYGFGNKYKYDVRRIKLAFPNLPAAFKGLKIVQISDIHSGSFTNKKAVEHGVDMILQQNADLILFTGDLVNNMAVEMDDYKDVFSKLKAPLGVFSTLGNHDYGDYVMWPQNGLTKEQNLQNVKQVHTDIGWRLLMNEHVALKRGDDAIALLGIENWSAKARFPKHGRMDLAYSGTEKYPFKILMSHDPSHWDAEVIPKYNDIDLMLSGHTHGMQFGVEIPGFKWSPVQYVYDKWAGLYENGKQKLYVNRGFGFIGYPGRVGILPEITLIELV